MPSPAQAGAAAPAPAAFTVQNLVSDQPGVAPVTDPDLINPWGLAASPTSPLWVANNGSDTSTLYAGGTATAPPTKAALIVAIPGGVPTGQAFNDTTSFVVTGPTGASGPARFLFVSESGQLTGWSPAAAPTTAIVAVNSPNAVYKGLALVHADSGPMLLATDIMHSRIDAFDGTFQRVQLGRDAFRDRALPRGFAPFNVAVLGDSVYVSFALRARDGQGEIDGRGLGFVDKFSLTGQFQRRIGSRGTLNAPWGMAIAPDSFGRVAGHLLVGNFGDGRISVFDTTGGPRGFDGLLRGTDGHPIVIDGLWSLEVGTAAAGGADGVLFSAGPDSEAHGLIGVIRAAS